MKHVSVQTSGHLTPVKVGPTADQGPSARQRIKKCDGTYETYTHTDMFPRTAVLYSLFSFRTELV